SHRYVDTVQRAGDYVCGHESRGALAVCLARMCRAPTASVPGNQLNDARFAELSDGPAPDHLAVAEDCDIVGDLGNLRQTVADKSNAVPIVAQGTNRVEQSRYLIDRQARRRFVEHKGGRLVTDAVESPSDSNKRALCRAQRGDGSPGVKVEPALG